MTTSIEAKTLATIYFEDISKGDVTGSPDITVTVDRDELIAYNRRYDYWPIHIDPAAARAAGFADVIASSGYILSLMLRLFHLNRENTPKANYAMVGGIDQRMKFQKPVQPGDVLRFVQTVLETRTSSKPGRGIITVRVEVINQREEVVLTFEAVNVIAGRPQ